MLLPKGAMETLGASDRNCKSLTKLGQAGRPLSHGRIVWKSLLTGSPGLPSCDLENCDKYQHRKIMRMSPRLALESFQGSPALVPRHKHPHQHPPGLACQDEQSLRMEGSLWTGSSPWMPGGPSFSWSLGGCCFWPLSAVQTAWP